jgi:hypothetical protein
VDTALKIKHHSLTGRIDFPLMYAAFLAHWFFEIGGIRVSFANHAASRQFQKTKHPTPHAFHWE